MTTHLYAIILRLAQNRLIESFLPLYRCFGLHSSCEVLKRSIALWKQRLSSSCRIHKEHRYFRITRSKTRSPPCRPQRSQDPPKNDRFLFIAIRDRFYFRKRYRSFSLQLAAALVLDLSKLHAGGEPNAKVVTSHVISAGFSIFCLIQFCSLSLFLQLLQSESR